MKTKMLKKMGLLTLLTGTLMMPNFASASGDRTTCSMTIYASKHQTQDAQASGECKGLVFGNYNKTDKIFVSGGMYSGRVVNGQTEEIVLPNSKYTFADITFYTVNDYTEPKPEPKPQPKPEPKPKPKPEPKPQPKPEPKPQPKPEPKPKPKPEPKPEPKPTVPSTQTKPSTTTPPKTSKSTSQTTTDGNKASTTNVELSSKEETTKSEESSKDKTNDVKKDEEKKDEEKKDEEKKDEEKKDEEKKDEEETVTLKAPDLTAGEKKESDNGFLFGGIALASAVIGGGIYFFIRKKL